MAAYRLVSQVAFGGNGINNPPNYNWTNYSNYPNLDLGKTYIRMNVMYPGDAAVIIQVTGLVELDRTGQPMLTPDSKVYLPCPPECP
jgi:hypothetical protein